MVVLPPGTLLQLMYLRERIAKVPAGRFIEIGPGSGEITKLLLDSGWSGSSYDIETKTIEALRMRFAKEIFEHRYLAINKDYLSLSIDSPTEKADLVISCMVMEHLDDADQLSFMQHSKTILNEGGRMIGLVPASPKHWGIEDEIAGHLRRYTSVSLMQLMEASKWSLEHIAGLTFPVSNMLLPISNFLVKRKESQKLSLSILERTKQSGKREIKFKTHFPSVLSLLLNETMLKPFDFIQRFFSKSEKCMVLYFESKPD